MKRMTSMIISLLILIWLLSSCSSKNGVDISDTTGYCSTKLTKIDNITFKIEYYDNVIGKNFEDFFMWDGNKFIKN